MSATIIKVSGPLVVAKGMSKAKMYEVVRVAEDSPKNLTKTRTVGFAKGRELRRAVDGPLVARAFRIEEERGVL